MAGVSSHIDDVNVLSHHRQPITVSDGDGLKRDPASIARCCHHLCVRPAKQQFGGSSDVIGVVMGLENGCQCQPLLLQPCLDRRGNGWVHDNGLSSADPDPDHVVLQNRKGVDGGVHR